MELEWTEILIRLAIATGLCAGIGLERELRGQSAGIRTHAVVGMGAALFTLGGGYGFGDLGAPADPGRVAAQVASGIGFLGAGVILRHGLDIRGLTTAATLWLAAAVGVATGAGMEIAALIAAVLVLPVLLSARLTRSLIDLRFRKVVKVRYRVGDGALGFVMQEIEERSRYLGRVRVVEHDDEGDGQERTVWLETELHSNDVDEVLAVIRSREGVVSAELDKAANFLPE